MGRAGRARQEEILGVRAVSRSADVAAGAPDVPPNEVRRPADDRPREIAAGDARQDRPMHHAGHVFYVARVDGSRFHRDEHFIAARLGRGDFFDLQLARVAEFVDDNGSHENSHLPDDALLE
jgi:hypothetical protein